MRPQILAEFAQMSRYSKGDPFKLAVYKVIGRCDLGKKSIVEVIQATEDYMWLQLMLVREEIDSDESAYERYTLRDLQDVIVTFGPEHFNAKKNSPFPYFQLLLLSGHFEYAIAYLYQVSSSDVTAASYATEAVHYGICLAFYGLLLFLDEGHEDTTTAASPSMELLVAAMTTTTDKFSRYRLDFSRILLQYARCFAKSDPFEALQYLLLLTLLDDSQKQRELCYHSIRELILDTQEYAVLLGEMRADGSHVPGLLEKYMRLLHFDGNRRLFLHELVEKTALQCEANGWVEDAMQLHHLAQNYDRVIEILNDYLGATISSSSNSTEEKTITASSLRLLKGEGSGNSDFSPILTMARGIHGYYASNMSFRQQISPSRWSTCETLLTLHEFFSHYRYSRLDTALDLLESLNLLPLNVAHRISPTYIAERVEQFRSLDPAITRNLSEILLAVMDLLFRQYTMLKESPFVDAARQTRMGVLKQKSRMVMTFSGMVQYRMPQETYARLSKLDVSIY
jgi:nuclear pore complex protein Nup93